MVDFPKLLRSYNRNAQTCARFDGLLPFVNSENTASLSIYCRFAFLSVWSIILHYDLCVHLMRFLSVIWAQLQVWASFNHSVGGGVAFMFAKCVHVCFCLCPGRSRPLCFPFPQKPDETGSHQSLYALMCVCVCVLVHFLLYTEHQNTHKVRTFLGRKSTVSGPHNFKGLFER